MGNFAKQTEAKYEDGRIRFFLGADEQRREYEISSDALARAFKAKDDTASALLDAFEAGQDAIIEAVQAVTHTPTADGILELGSGDFEARNTTGKTTIQPHPATQKNGV